MPHRITPRKYHAYKVDDLDQIPGFHKLRGVDRLAMRAVARVLPFRVNSYVTDELIDWDRVPDDPIFRLTFPQPEMLAPAELQRLINAMARGANAVALERTIREIQLGMNPQPAGQIELNVPELHGLPLPGMQHKYRETVLFFPGQGQTCHAYCTYCFRWAQFVGLDELKFASREAEQLVEYLKLHKEVSSVLLTGGDPLIMNTRLLRRYIEPLLQPELAHITSVRLGTKSLAYWPYRFVTDDDADDLLKLFEEIRSSGRNLAFMAHFSHPKELETPVVQVALRRIQASGAVVRCQAPLIRGVNDSALLWADMWRLQVQLGAVPYYMFIERDTGPKDYFGVPLARAVEIFGEAYRHVSGLARTVRGPSMSATAGKVVVDSTLELEREKVFVLRFLQARDPSWVGRAFLARFDPEATWLDQLRPAGGQERFFFEDALARIKKDHRSPPWGEAVPPRRPAAIFGHVEWE